MEKAMFGAGCFWGVEAAFRQIEGVTQTAVGYAGGSMEKPTYKDVCRAQTGHAEVVLVTYDPTKVNYKTLVDLFWKSHDPTQLNRQGPDVGSQYRSAIFYFNDEQKQIAAESMEQLQQSDLYKDRGIVTQIEAASAFWIAEDYHQQYLEKRGLSSCHLPPRDTN